MEKLEILKDHYTLLYDAYNDLLTKNYDAKDVSNTLYANGKEACITILAVIARSVDMADFDEKIKLTPYNDFVRAGGTTGTFDFTKYYDENCMECEHICYMMQELGLYNIRCYISPSTFKHVTSGNVCQFKTELCWSLQDNTKTKVVYAYYEKTLKKLRKTKPEYKGCRMRWVTQNTKYIDGKEYFIKDLT